MENDLLETLGMLSFRHGKNNGIEVQYETQI